MSFFKELKRRNVFKVTIAYVVMAWLILQVADVILNNVEAPGWVFHVILLLLGIGLLFAIFFAWAYELTPEGIKKEKDIDRTQSITHVTGRKLDYIIIAVLVLALGYFAFDKFMLDPSRHTELVQATTETVTEQVTGAGKEETANKSIAVLPFVNMSSDSEQEYFSDGISEELLNQLTRIPDLRVIARTSSFAFKGKDVKIADVAHELNVDHVLEGSVRKSGNQVRITAQLIYAADSSHLWSETYDRTLDDIFAIQDEIAAAVVKQLKVTLLGAAPTVEETQPEAYALYLQATQLSRGATPWGFDQSIVLFRQALEIAPDYAAAWLNLAVTYAAQGSFGLRPFNESSELAREAANRALAINPSSASAHATLGRIAMEHDRDLAAAVQHLKRAQALEPTNTYALLVASDLAQVLGQTNDAVALLEYLVARDPFSPPRLGYMGRAYLWAGRPDEAIASFRAALKLSPGFVMAQLGIGWGLLQTGEPEAALAAVRKESSEVHQLLGLALIHHALGQVAESDVALAKLIEKHEQNSPAWIAFVLAFRGETDRSFVWLDKAAQNNDPELTTLLGGGFANIHDDPRWPPFLERIGKAPTQLAALEFEVILPE